MALARQMCLGIMYDSMFSCSWYKSRVILLILRQHCSKYTLNGGMYPLSSQEPKVQEDLAVAPPRWSCRLEGGSSPPWVRNPLPCDNHRPSRTDFDALSL